MKKKAKNQITYEMGVFLKNHRINVLHEPNLLDFSYSSNFDNSKLAKIEKGEVDIKLTTFMKILKAYKVSMDDRTILLDKLEKLG